MTMSDHIIDRLKTAVARHGVWGVAGKLWHKVAAFLYYSSCSTWYERDLQAPVPAFTPAVDVKAEFLRDDKMKLVHWLRENSGTYPWIYFEEEIDAAMKYDHLFLLLTHLERIIGYVKIGRGHTYIHDFDRLVEFPPGTAFVYDTFTLPEYRGKNLALFALNNLCDYLKAHDYRRILCHIEAWNVPSIKTFEKAGFRAIDSIRFFRAARVAFFVRSGCRPFRCLDNYLREAGLAGRTYRLSPGRG